MHMGKQRGCYIVCVLLKFEFMRSCPSPGQVNRTPSELYSAVNNTSFVVSVCVCVAVCFKVCPISVCVCRHVFRPDCLPQKRFLVYQMCDLEEESLQRLIHANDGQEPSTCNVSELF